MERVARITDKKGAYAAFYAVGGDILEKVRCHPVQGSVHVCGDSAGMLP